MAWLLYAVPIEYQSSFAWKNRLVRGFSLALSGISLFLIGCALGARYCVGYTAVDTKKQDQNRAEEKIEVQTNEGTL